jgi:uncharacterized Zn-finger protein
MATENYRIVRCPYCSNEFEAKFWSVVRGDIDINIKEIIINGEFNLLMCPQCQKIFSLEENFIYLDPSAKILAFVMPGYYKERKELVEKLKDDYNLIKEHLISEGKLNFKPYYLFGIDELIDILKNDMDIQEETDVIYFVCEQKKLNVKKIDKIRAREKGLPFIMPYSKGLSRADIIKTLKEIIKENKKLKRLQNLINELEKNGEDIDFLDED